MVGRNGGSGKLVKCCSECWCVWLRPLLWVHGNGSIAKAAFRVSFYFTRLLTSMVQLMTNLVNQGIAGTILENTFMV